MHITINKIDITIYLSGIDVLTSGVQIGDLKGYARLIFRYNLAYHLSRK